MRRLETIAFTAEGARFHGRSFRCDDLSYAADRAVHGIYRALGKHIRRHLAPGCDKRIRRLRASFKPGRQLQHTEKDTVAWAYMMWSSRLEPLATVRMWEEVRPRHKGVAHQLSRAALDYHFVAEDGQHWLRRDHAEWLLEHVSAVLLRLIWSRALALAQGMTQAGELAWGPGMLEEQTDLRFRAARAPSGALRLTCQGPAVEEIFKPRVTHATSDRKQAAAQMLEQRAERIRAQCRGPCLRFDFQSGWAAIDGTLPSRDFAGTDVRRHRLFVPGRPVFYLFRVAQGYCARLVHPPIEASDKEPWRAIDTLRHAAMRYCERFSPNARAA